MKSVCIVGAGPGGLVTAKTFLQTGEFEITVYEKKDRIGGIWALDRNSKDGFLSPYTPTNLSRFTVGFSDLDWNSVDYENTKGNHLQNGDIGHTKTPMFPKAWMANRYLETYRSKYVPDGIIQTSREVVKAEQKGDSWTVTTKDRSGQVEERNFDYLVMASGFFNSPQSLHINQPSLDAASSNLLVKVIHSSAFRDLDDFLPKDKDLTGKTILMIGGGNSSGETAAAVALQLSNAQWTPMSTSRDRIKGCKIVHVTPRPIYAIPHFNEYEEGSKSFLPLDFKLYDFGRRPKDMPSYAGKQTMEVRNMVHGLMQTLVGGDQSDLTPLLSSPKGESRGTAYVALTESYPEYVRSGLIEVRQGRVTHLRQGEDGLASAVVRTGSEEVVIDGVAAVINAKGYTPAPAISMLDEGTKDAVEFDSNSTRLPMILDQWQTMNQAAPNVSFIGFYEGPYWPMMEMQARLTAHRWLSASTSSQRIYEAPETLRDLRRAMQAKAKDVPQFWFGDYLGYLQDIANELELPRHERPFREREGPTSPARYRMEKTDVTEADSILSELHQTWHDCIENGKFVPRAALRAMHGNWTIERKIDSAIATFPSGILEGTATFHPRVPTSDKSGKSFDLEYLYVESGTFTMSTGHTMTASRRYVYRYSEADDTLSVWFVKPDNPLEVDYLFHDLTFVKPAEAREAGACVAKADHLCVEDMYWTEYRLPLKGIALTQFEVKHTVKGPEKDYIATTKYSRPSRA
jgi:hypothetical protein